jgi:acyl-CoA thioester hydrolase
VGLFSLFSSFFARLGVLGRSNMALNFVVSRRQQLLSRVQLGISTTQRAMSTCLNRVALLPALSNISSRANSTKTTAASAGPGPGPGPGAAGGRSRRAPIDIHKVLSQHHQHTSYKVQWGDMDAFSHVNNVIYIRMIENGRIAYLRALEKLATIAAQLPRPGAESGAESGAGAAGAGAGVGAGHSESEVKALHLFLSGRAVGPIVKSVNCTYRFPLTFPDTVTIGSYISSIESDRVTMQHVVVSNRHKIIAADASSTLVSFDYQQRQKAPIPPLVLTAIKHLEDIGPSQAAEKIAGQFSS